MRATMIAAVLVLGLVLPGCTDTGTPDAVPAVSPSALGGERPASARPPSRRMDRLEETIAGNLSRELRGQGLVVDYLDCPDRRTPTTMVCRGYVEGVAVGVRVRLTGPPEAVLFEARLGKGILATANLVRRLAAEGYRRIDCGERSAYPTVVGSRIVCSVTGDGTQKYVVATVTTDAGRVEISDY